LQTVTKVKGEEEEKSAPEFFLYLIPWKNQSTHLDISWRKEERRGRKDGATLFRFTMKGGGRERRKAGGGGGG